MSTSPSPEHDLGPSLVEALFPVEPVRPGRRRLEPAQRGHRRRGPVRRGHTRFAVAAVALTAAVLLLVVGSFAALQSLVPWMTWHNQPASVSVNLPPVDSGVEVLAAAGPSAAERVLDAVVSTPVPGLGGWTASKPSSLVSVPNLGFGCDPKDGLSAAVTRSRSWTSGTGAATASLTVSLRAYPAGGAAVALDGITGAALACDSATLGSPGLAPGVEAAHVETSRVATLLWRRGDVLVLASIQDSGHAGSPSAYGPALTAIDTALADALDGVCADPAATSDAAARSPYLGVPFEGHHVVEQVRFERRTRDLSAEQFAVDPAVEIPGTALGVVEVEAPAVPVPAPSEGPTGLPAPLAVPVAPSAPTSPPLAVAVDRSVADPTGPGCGWAFTGQAEPGFDDHAAARAYRLAVTSAEHRVRTAWKRWQQARATYFTAYALYTAAAADYTDYATEVEAARAAWAVIDAARSEYETALATWQTESDAHDAWEQARQAAKAEWKAARQACRDLDEPDPSTPPTPAPTEPSASPTDTPETLCPPTRPEGLDAPEPSVTTSPTPVLEAQLPPA